MSSIKMVALIKHPFGTGERDAGEEYEATTDEAATLIALGWAEKAPENKAANTHAPAPAPAPEREEKQEKAHEAAAGKKSLDSTADDKKRGYQRRDMKAKG